MQGSPGKRELDSRTWYERLRRVGSASESSIFDGLRWARRPGCRAAHTSGAPCAGDTYTASTGAWEKKDGQAWQRGLRGGLTYPVTVPRSGVHALRFTVSARQDGGLDEGYDFRVSLNGKPISYQTVTIPENGTAALAVLTPWLRAGESYQFELYVDNSYNSRRISVDRVETLAASGVDANGNGVTKV
jgi:hypothetical protein